MSSIDDATLDVLAAQATDPDHEPQDRVDAAAMLGEPVASDVWAAERVTAALAKVVPIRALSVALQVGLASHA